MLDICLLGTGGMMPLPRRYLTSMLARCDGANLLIDCGEGTQTALHKVGWSPKPIDIICFTHYHADHISGLPGLLLTMGNAERTEPILFVGPKGLERVVNSLRVIAPELPFEICFKELHDAVETFAYKSYTIDAYKVNHNVTCYGYTINIQRKGLFDVEAAKAANIPLKFWNKLQHGETIVDGDKTYVPEMVMGASRRGIKVSYSTDTRPVPVIAEFAKNADLMICEGMYGEEDKLEKAKGYKHMTMYEAAQLACIAQPEELWFTHYSPSMNRPDEYIDKVREIFPRAKVAHDGWIKEIGYKDE